MSSKSESGNEPLRDMMGHVIDDIPSHTSSKWDDDLVIEFARAYANGKYTVFKGIRGVEAKLSHFKKLKKIS